MGSSDSVGSSRDVSASVSRYRNITVRLTEQEVASLNLYLKSKGYDSHSDFVHSLIQGRFTREELQQLLASTNLVPHDPNLFQIAPAMTLERC